MGHQSDLYALTIDDDLAGDVRPFADAGAAAGDLTIFHYALPSPMTEAFARLPRGRILQYHNVTPAHFFAPYDAGIFRLARLGRDELATLAGRTDMALGDSAYNQAELDGLGFDNTGVFPIAIDVGRITAAPRRPALERVLDDGPLNFLFVGRIVPNKKIEDHIRLAEVYKRYVDVNYRFIFVGKTDGVPRYYDMIRALIAEYQMPADRFLFTGPVPDEDLATYYRTASVYISLSEHEGFCVPLLEAMAADVPVLAYGATAVPDTLGGAGVQFTPKDLELAAELLGALAYDEALRARVIAGQRRRLADFGDARVQQALEAAGGRRRPPFARPGGPSRSSIVRIAFIVQRYGAEILGGSEYHCRLIAERLATRHDVEVLTTCARDYVTWRNEYPEGNDRIKGVTVRRFGVAAPRDINAFNQYSDWIFHHPHSREDELKWLEMQGPWSPALKDYLTKHHRSYDALIFFTYLYAPTVLGLRVDPGRSILVPTAHDEPAIHLGIYKEMFRLPAAMAYNTEVEREFLKTRFEIAAGAEEVVGCGVDLMPGGDAGGQGPREDRGPERALPSAIAAAMALDEPAVATADDDESPAHLTHRGARFQRRHRLHGQFLLYGGRIDPGKGCEELLEYFTSYKEQAGDADLVLMGVKLMQLPEVPWVRFAGLLSERERLEALEAATIVVVPSPFESLSLLALEAMAVGTPVLVQRPQRRAGGTLPPQSGRALVQRPRRVRRRRQAAAGRRSAAPDDGAQRQGVRQARVPLGRDHGEVRPADSACAALRVAIQRR